MTREIIVTSDGSHSISIPEMGVTYHSSHGAIQESMHVFIESGLRYLSKKDLAPSGLSVLEMGFGTGLNTLLTAAEAASTGQYVYYETIEPHPLEMSIALSLNYCDQLNRPDLKNFFTHMHECKWDTVVELIPHFSFKKINSSLIDYIPNQLFNIIYFDAFAPDVQPDLWTSGIFKKMYDAMKPDAVLTTYCSKSIVRKAMSEAGLSVEKIPGPPHKREIVRAVKKQPV